MNTPKHKALLVFATICVLLGASFVSNAQDSIVRKNTWFPIPIAYYKPETGLALGAAGAYNFYLDKQDLISPPSQLQLSAVFTQKGQMSLALPFSFFWNERKHTLTGQFEYNDFSYDFYGVGTGNAEGISENYNVRFPLFRINYLRKVRQHLYLGARWWYEDYRVYDFEKSPSLTSGNITGGRGGVTSGPGIVALYDSRDNVYFSSKGLYVELVAHDQAKHWGSQFSYQRYRFDARHFAPLNNSWSLGSMLFGDFVTGNVPFNQLASIGSDKRMRGFYYGRYRDNNLLLYQGELHGYFYKRWGAAVFWNYALLSEEIEKMSFKNDHASVGAGLRFAFDKEKKTNIRLDVAVPVGSGAYKHNYTNNPFILYLTINEAF